MRSLTAGIVALLVACTEVPTEPAELGLGSADIRVSGAVAFQGAPIVLPDRIVGTACERLGWVNLFSTPPVAVAVFVPGELGFQVGEYAMQPLLDTEPTGHVNTPGIMSLSTLAGETHLTRVTANEIQGRIDWTVGYPDAPEAGSLRLRGIFRSRRDGDACMPANGAAQQADAVVGSGLVVRRRRN